MKDWFLPGLDADRISAFYRGAPGNEFDSGKFGNPDSSAALVANAFGYFLAKPQNLPPLPGVAAASWSPQTITLETILRFPWRGGHHPCLDVVVGGGGLLTGIESKRHEPFRDKHAPDFSDAYWRPVWGQKMRGFEAVRDALHDGSLRYRHLGAGQLVKHAFGLRSEMARRHDVITRAILFYLYAEAPSRADGTAHAADDHVRHRREIADFAGRVADDEVAFLSCSYENLLAVWRTHGPETAAHADALAARFVISPA
ncbi:MAG TPA: hypothetical protein VG821_07450 [Rhizomicrobium sp.]|nr:hypothetical protein [Rhizomicrobium sp.]